MLSVPPILCAVLALINFAIAQSSPFDKYTISAPGINASFIAYGARLTNLFVNDKKGDPQDVVLGYDNGTDYATKRDPYFGPVVG